jgi:hypothetical protein
MMLLYLLHHNVFDVTLTDIFQCVNADNMTRRDPKENVQLTDELYLSECWILNINIIRINALKNIGQCDVKHIVM